MAAWCCRAKRFVRADRRQVARASRAVMGNRAAAIGTALDVETVAGTIGETGTTGETVVAVIVAGANVVEKRRANSVRRCILPRLCSLR